MKSTSWLHQLICWLGGVGGRCIDRRSQRARFRATGVVRPTLLRDELDLPLTRRAHAGHELVLPSSFTRESIKQLGRRHLADLTRFTRRVRFRLFSQPLAAHGLNGRSLLAACRWTICIPNVERNLPRAVWLTAIDMQRLAHFFNGDAAGHRRGRQRHRNLLKCPVTGEG